MVTQQLPNTSDLLLGFMHVRVKTTFRGRRGVPLQANPLKVREIKFKAHSEEGEPREDVRLQNKPQLHIQPGQGRIALLR